MLMLRALPLIMVVACLQASTLLLGGRTTTLHFMTLRRAVFCAGFKRM